MNAKDWCSLHKKTSNNKNTPDKQQLENNNENKNNIKTQKATKNKQKKSTR
jgi:hypothetical protein